MSVKETTIKDLIPDDSNFNKGNEFGESLIEKSFSKFGAGRSILLDKNNKIVAGNKSTQKFVEQGGQKVLVVETDGETLVAVKRTDIDLNTKRGREMALADNATAKANIEWDFEVLPEWFDSKELDDWGVIDFSLESEDESEAQDSEPQIDKAEELNKKWEVVPGDLWAVGESFLLCGDSTKAEDVERVLNGAKPNLMITDPPYGVEYDANWRNEAQRPNGKPYGAFAISEVENDHEGDWTPAWQLFEGNVAYVWHAGRHAMTVQASLEIAGFEVRSQIIWAKSNFAISRGHYHWKHEPCWYVVRKGEKANWIGDHSQVSLWEIDKPMKSETGHSTQKPLECMARPIRNHEGDVYEPFAGSGTTLVACQNLKRKCYAIEISPNYCAVILERMQTAFPDLEIKRIEQSETVSA